MTAAPAGSPDGARESRCICGSLLARITPSGVELKCRRCKRIVLVPWRRNRRTALRGAPSHERDPP